jgi:hypothetical protein
MLYKSQYVSIYFNIKAKTGADSGFAKEVGANHIFDSELKAPPRNKFYFPTIKVYTLLLSYAHYKSP